MGRPDLIFSSHLTETRTRVVTSHISDHFPLITTYDLAWEYNPPRAAVRLRYQFAKADWARFQREVDQLLDPHLLRMLQTVRLLPSTSPRAQVVDTGASHPRSVLLQAAKAIPKSVRLPGFPPFWNTDCQRAEADCQDRYRRYVAHP